jgi:hypothetical protein
MPFYYLAMYINIRVHLIKQVHRSTRCHNAFNELAKVPSKPKWGAEVQLHTFLISALNTGELLTLHTSCTAPRKNPSTQYIKDSMGPMASPDIQIWLLLTEYKEHFTSSTEYLGDEDKHSCLCQK